MPKLLPSHVWKPQELNKDIEIVDCPELDSHKDFKRDPSGNYVLIRLNFDQYRIEVGIADKNHKIAKIFSGRKPQDIYDAIFAYEKKHGIAWFEEKTHMAYLGKELKKAELALASGNASYFQE